MNTRTVCGLNFILHLLAMVCVVWHACMAYLGLPKSEAKALEQSSNFAEAPQVTKNLPTHSPNT